MKVVMLDGAGFSPPYDFNLVRGLEAAGASVRLVMPEAIRREWEEPDGKPAAPPSRLAKSVGRFTKAASYAALLKSTSQLIERWQPDVVHVQWLALPLADTRFLRAIGRRTRLVHTMHNTSLFHGSTGGVQGWGLRDALACFDRIVVHSEYSRSAASRMGMVESEKLRVIPHGAFDYYKRFTENVVRASAPVQLLFAGSIKAYKGLDVLLDALPTLVAHTTPGSWHLTIAGHSTDRLDSLKQAIAGKGLGSCITWSVRHQTERELGELLGAADIVVLPYREIDQSGVLLAAVGVERAVVASRVGAFPELLKDEQHGLLVPPEDPEALGQALARLVVDGGLRAYCEQQMHRLATQSLSWSTVGRTTFDLYQEIANT